MKRRLLNLVTALSLLLCVAVVALWANGVVRPRYFPHRTIERDRNVLMETYGGFGWNGSGLTFERYEDHTLVGQKYNGEFRRVGTPTVEDEEYAAFMEAAQSREPLASPGFAAGSFEYTRTDKFSPFATASRFTVYGRRTVLVVPFYQLALATGFLPMTWLAVAAGKALRKRPAPGHCRSCGYDLRATPGRCPECGTEAPTPAGGDGSVGERERSGEGHPLLNPNPNRLPELESD